MRRLGPTLIPLLVAASCLPDFRITEQGSGGDAAVGDAGGASGGLGGSSPTGGAAGAGGSAAATGGVGGASDAAAGAGGGDPCATKDCLGGKCSAGACEPVELSRAGLRYGTGITVTDSHVYFTNAQYASNPEPAAIYRCPLAGCGAGELARETVVPAEQAYDVVASQGYLYWSTSLSPGAVKRCALPSCNNPQTLTKQLTMQVRRISVDDANFYFGDYSTASSCPLTGCSLVTGYGFTPSAVVFKVATSASWVFWSATDGSLWRALKTDGTSAKMLAGGAALEAFALDADNAYLALNPPAGAIQSCPLAGCGGAASPKQVTSLENAATALIVDGAWIYWAEGGSSLTADGSIKRVPLGGGVTSVIATKQAHPVALAGDAKALYWLNGGLLSPGEGGSVMRWAK